MHLFVSPMVSATASLGITIHEAPQAKQSSLLYKRENEISSGENSSMPRNSKQPKTLPRSINYLLKEQRLLFILVGILNGSTFFICQPTLTHLSAHETSHRFSTLENRHIQHYPSNFGAKTGRVPVEIGRRRLRIVVTGRAGFVGSHLVDKLINRGDEVLVIDNFFTGRKENLVHHLGNPRFALTRHDVVEPILLEVDQIYHLAYPTSPVHYKYNPVVKEVIDSSATTEFRPNTADDSSKRKPDNGKAKESLNWEPKISLRQGLPRMVSDFRNRILNEDEGKGTK